MDINKLASQIIKEANDGAKHSHHCVMVYLQDNSSEKDYGFFKIQQLVPKECIYREFPLIDGPLKTKIQDPKDTYGLEHDPHITLLFGNTNENDYFKARKIFSEIEKPKFTIGEISSFRIKDKPFDVLKLSIISPDFEKLNKELSKFPNENEFKDYIPHMTICYLKKDCCKDLEGRCDLTGKEYICDVAKWSHVDGYKLDLPFKS